jgi:hypothetical protein
MFCNEVFHFPSLQMASFTLSVLEDFGETMIHLKLKSDIFQFVVAHSCNPSNQETVARIIQVGNQPRL